METLGDRTGRARGAVAIRLAAALLLGAVLGLGSSGEAGAAQVWVEAWRHETSRPLEGVAMGDVDGDGRAEVVTLSQGTVVVYALEDEGPRFLTAVEGIQERPTAVAVRRQGDEEAAALWVGTENPGFTYVFRYDPKTRSFERTERIRYAWGDIERLVPLDLDGFGGVDLAALTKGRELVVFRWTPSGYVRLDAGGVDREVRFLEAADLDGDGRDELVVARGVNHLVVLKWQPSEAEEESEEVQTEGGRLERVWENYPWGAHLALLVGRFQPGSPQIVVASSQRVVHHFAYSTEGYRALRTPVEWTGMSGTLVGTVDIDGDGRVEAVEATRGGLVAWRIGSQVSQALTIELSAPSATFVQRDSATGQLVVAGARGFSLLKLEDANYVRVIRRGVPVELSKPARLVDGVAYLSADDWAALLEMRIRYDAETKMISGLKGFRFLLGRVGGGEWMFGGRSTTTRSVPFIEDGVLYLGADFASVVGGDVVWEPYTRTLVVYP